MMISFGVATLFVSTRYRFDVLLSDPNNNYWVPFSSAVAKILWQSVIGIGVFGRPAS